MKWMIASDIHGSAYFGAKLADRFEKEGAQRLILLGDLLYHGPRNDLPEGYAPKELIPILNGLKDRIFCVRGNCDSEVDQMVLEFPILSDYAVFAVGDTILYATHGHIFHEGHMPPLKKGSCFLYGHTHIPEMKEKDGYLFLNPGSVSIPKGGSENSYMIFEDGIVRLVSLDGSTLMESGKYCTEQ